MIFTKNDSYDLNPLSMPRLQQDELYNIPDVLVRKINENVGVIRFSDILEIARKNNMSILEAGYNIIRDHGIHGFVAVVNENRMLIDDSYYLAVLESCKHINMQYGSSLDRDIFLQSLIEEDIISDTNNLDIILESGAYSGVNDANRHISSDMKQVSTQAGGFFNRMGQKVKNWGVSKALGFIDDGLRGNNTVEKVAKSGQNLGHTLGKNVVKGFGDEVSKTASKWGTRAATLAAAGGGLYIFRKQLNNLTNQERMGRIKTKKAFFLKRWLLKLKEMLARLIRRRKTAPPSQQSKLSNMIARVQNKIHSLQGGNHDGMVY